MSHSRKYVQILEDSLSLHVPSEKQMLAFHMAMSKILNRSVPKHEKVQQYYELLKRKMVPSIAKQPEEGVQPSRQDPANLIVVKQELSTKEDYRTFVLNSFFQTYEEASRSFTEFFQVQIKPKERGPNRNYYL